MGGNYKLVLEPNWEIEKIQKSTFTKKENQAILISENDHYPRVYYKMRDRNTDMLLYIEKTYVGIDSLYYMNVPHTNFTVIVLTFMVCIFDYCNNVVVSTIKIRTCCQKMIYQNSNLYLVCETEILKYQLETLKCMGEFKLPEIICDTEQIDHKLILHLYDKSSVTIDL